MLCYVCMYVCYVCMYVCMLIYVMLCNVMQECDDVYYAML
jgi:hypothetical protein